MSPSHAWFLHIIQSPGLWENLHVIVNVKRLPNKILKCYELFLFDAVGERFQIVICFKERHFVDLFNQINLPVLDF